MKKFVQFIVRSVLLLSAAFLVGAVAAWYLDGGSETVLGSLLRIAIVVWVAVGLIREFTYGFRMRNGKRGR